MSANELLEGFKTQAAVLKKTQMQVKKIKLIIYLGEGNYLPTIYLLLQESILIFT